MKRLLIAALIALIPVVASASPSIPTSDLPSHFVVQELLSRTPTWFWNLPKQERIWISGQIAKNRYIWRQTFYYLVLSYNRELLKLDYGKPGYADHKAAFLMFRELLAMRDPIPHASWSMRHFLSHVDNRLAYQYQHHDYLSPAARKRAQIQKARDEKQAAEKQAEVNAANALAKQSAENQRLSSLFGYQIAERVRVHWQPVFASNLGLQCRLEIKLSPQGQLAGPPTVTQPSGNAKFDAAVIAAIEASAPFPPPSGLPYSEFKVVNIVFSAKELSNG